MTLEEALEKIDELEDVIEEKKDEIRDLENDVRNLESTIDELEQEAEIYDSFNLSVESIDDEMKVKTLSEIWQELRPHHIEGLRLILKGY